MLHLVIEVIENYEGMVIKASRKFGNGASKRSHYTTAVEMQNLPVLRHHYIAEKVEGMIMELTAEDNPS